MATVQNRSRWWVEVTHRADLARTFPFNAVKTLEAYVADLRTHDFKPRFGQLEDTIEVRLREKGFKEAYFTAGSYAEADALIQKVEEERKRGLFIDYNRSQRVSFAELLVRYLEDECPRHKGCRIESYKLEAWLADSGPEGQALLEQRRERQRTAGQTTPPNGFKMRKTTAGLKWLHKPLAMVQTTDIEDYIQERLEEVEPATVDRELDLISAVFNVAIKVWAYPLSRNPMDGVRRPKYFNERDRRLVGDEEERLLAAARAQDRQCAVAARVEELVRMRLVDHPPFSSASARKKVLAALRKELLGEAERTCVPIPRFEAFVQFQLMTGARRSETLGLEWQHVNCAEQTAFLPETKNGRARNLALRQAVIALLQQLPRDSERVFALSVDMLRAAWFSMCEHAGIVDLLIHDLRHEAVSRMAECGRGFASGGFFSLADLQAFSGHRDVRMLLRYTHLCAGRLAQALDQALEEGPKHKGRRRLTERGPVTITALVEASAETPHPGRDTPVEFAQAGPAEPRRPSPATETASNVIPFAKRSAA